MQPACSGPRGELTDADAEAGPQPSRRLCSRAGFSPRRLWHALRGVLRVLLDHQLERPRGAGGGVLDTCTVGCPAAALPSPTRRWYHPHLPVVKDVAKCPLGQSRQ